MDIVDDCDLNEVEFVSQREYVKHIWFEDPITNSEVFDKICGTNLVYLTKKLETSKNKEHMALLWDDIQKVLRNLPDEAIKCIIKTFDEGVEDLDLICEKALEFFGEENQINKCIEECVELIIGLVKVKNENASEEDILKIIEGYMEIHDIEDWKANVFEELADTKIMTKQMEILFDAHDEVVKMKEYKLQRLNEMIEE